MGGAKDTFITCSSVKSAPQLSHVAHVAFGLPSFLRLKPTNTEEDETNPMTNTFDFSRRMSNESKSSQRRLQPLRRRRTWHQSHSHTWPTWTQTQARRTPRLFASSFSAPPSKRPLPVCAAQSRGNRRLQRFSQPAIWRQTEERSIREWKSVCGVWEVFRLMCRGGGSTAQPHSHTAHGWRTLLKCNLHDRLWVCIGTNLCRTQGHTQARNVHHHYFFI